MLVGEDFLIAIIEELVVFLESNDMMLHFFYFLPFMRYLVFKSFDILFKMLHAIR